MTFLSLLFIAVSYIMFGMLIGKALRRRNNSPLNDFADWALRRYY